jgi:hypothetical protein
MLQAGWCSHCWATLCDIVSEAAYITKAPAVVTGSAWRAKGGGA